MNNKNFNDDERALRLLNEIFQFPEQVIDLSTPLNLPRSVVVDLNQQCSNSDDDDVIFIPNSIDENFINVYWNKTMGCAAISMIFLKMIYPIALMKCINNNDDNMLYNQFVVEDDDTSPLTFDLSTFLMLLVDGSHDVALNLRGILLSEKCRLTTDHKKKYLYIKREMLLNEKLLHLHFKASILWAFRRNILNQYENVFLKDDLFHEMHLIQKHANSTAFSYDAWAHWNWFWLFQKTNKILMKVDGFEDMAYNFLKQAIISTPLHFGPYHYMLILLNEKKHDDDDGYYSKLLDLAERLLELYPDAESPKQFHTTLILKSMKNKQ